MFNTLYILKMDSLLFTPGKIGPLTIRNRVIRSAAFESMCPGNAPSQELLDYHQSVAAGGVGMTTVAYAAVTRSGLSFDRQLWMRPEIVSGLMLVTDAVHKEGAAASIQLGHCGNMSHSSICGQMPVGASSGFNLYSPTFVRGLRKEELPQLAKDYGKAVSLARQAGFDAVEIHAGHGYLISQFLSPYTNHRHDEFGGSLENRMRFMDMVMEEVMKAARNDMAVIVKMNMRDGFKGGMDIDESLEVAKRLKDPMDLVFLFWSISCGIITGAGQAEIAFALSFIVTVALIVFEKVPVAKAAKILMVSGEGYDIEEKVSSVCKKYCSNFTTKSCSLANSRTDLVIEVKSDKDEELLKEIASIQNVTSSSLLKHDGEVTY